MTQMDEPMKPGAQLEVSVSFGRFENDALSWEKWSSFSPNKYLEEAGNLSTPGSVAQKRAYFEAHYKKIAARKAAELEQEKLMVPIIPYPPVVDSLDIDSKSGLLNGERLVEEVAEESCTTLSTNGPVFDEEEDDGDSDPPKRSDPETYMNVNGAHDDDSDSPKRDDLVYMNMNVAAPDKCGSFEIEEMKDEVNGYAEGPRLNVSEDNVVLLESAAPQKDSRRMVEKQASALRKGVPKMNARNMAQKVTPTTKERTWGGAKNKVLSPVVKPSPTFSSPRNSKPSLMNTPASAPKTLRKQVPESRSPLLKSKNSSLAGQSKRSATAKPALHMSLSLSSVNSLSSGPMRKSLIMEKMGDKDIVKRAFKAFQNRSSGPALVEKLSPAKHMSPTEVKPKVTASRNLTKGNPRKDSINQATQRSQVGTRSDPLPKGLHKTCTVERKDTMAFSLTSGLRDDEKAQKRKEFLKKLEAKAIAREMEKAQLSAKSKVCVGNEIHPQHPTLSR